MDSTTSTSTSILTAENPDRFTIFPIVHKKIWDKYEEQRANFWWDTDVVFSSSDEKDWESLTDGEKNFIENILAFFASADGIVMENLAERFLREVQLPEARAFFTIQLNIELVHSIVYAKLLDGYVRDNKRKMELLRANQTSPAIKDKTDWAIKWMRSDASLAERLVAFVCVEGIFFRGEFCAIFWMKEKNKLNALTISNYLIARDEILHLNFGCLLYTDYVPAEERLSEARIHSIVRDAVEVEKRFINDVLDCSLIGMTKELMGEYIEYEANQICDILGYSEPFVGARQPFEFMDRQFFDSKENFFETPVTSYQMPKSNVSYSMDEMRFEGDF